MFRKITLAAVAAIGLGALGFSTGASAAAYSPGSPLPVLESVSDNVQTAQSQRKRQKRVWKYNQRRDGNRFRQRHGKAYLYEARGQGEIAGELGSRAVREALEKYGAPALMGFVRNLSPEQRAIVSQLLNEEAAPESGHSKEEFDDQ